MPTGGHAFMALVHAGWDVEADGLFGSLTAQSGGKDGGVAPLARPRASVVISRTRAPVSSRAPACRAPPVAGAATGAGLGAILGAAMLPQGARDRASGGSQWDDGARGVARAAHAAVPATTTSRPAPPRHATPSKRTCAPAPPA